MVPTNGAKSKIVEASDLYPATNVRIDDESIRIAGLPNVRK